jgi:flavorubredoxin
MPVTNPETGTSIDEIARGIYRINTPAPGVPGGFSFNQILIVDDEPLLFHTGPRRMFPLVSQAIEAVIPVASLRWVGFSHVESDESGGLNDFLAAAPRAEPLCGQIAKMVSVDDLADRPARALADGEALELGEHTVRWLDAPHLPHGWETGYLFESATRTLLCGDLFTQPGATTPALTRDDILGPSEAFRGAIDYYSATRRAGPLIEKLARTEPTTLACMHGSAATSSITPATTPRDRDR